MTRYLYMVRGIVSRVNIIYVLHSVADLETILGMGGGRIFNNLNMVLYKSNIIDFYLYFNENILSSPPFKSATDFIRLEGLTRSS